MNLSNRNKIFLLAAAILLVCGAAYFIHSKLSKQDELTPKDLIVHYDSESFLNVNNEMTRLANDIKYYLETIKKIGKSDVSAFEKFQLAGKRVKEGYNDHYIVTPILDSNNHYYGNWWIDTNTAHTLTNNKSGSFYFNIRRQHLPDGKIKDHLVVILDNIDVKYCPGSIRDADVTVAPSNGVVVNDETYADGCTRESNGTVHYFASVAQREKKEGDKNWQWVE